MRIDDFFILVVMIYFLIIILYPVIKAVIKYFMRPRFYTVEIKKVIRKTETSTTWKCYTFKIPRKKNIIVTIDG